MPTQAESRTVMFGQSKEIPSIPSETVRAARAVFSRRNFYIRVGEQLEFMLDDIQVDCLSKAANSTNGRGAVFALATFFEFMEGLTDEQTIDAVRTRIDWKYALHLPVNTLTFHQNALCKFRQKVISDPVCQREFQNLIDRLVSLNPPYSQVIQNFEILAMLSSICSMNLLHWAQEAMGATLGALASKFPEWLLKIAQPHWYWRFNCLSPLANSASSIRQGELSIEKLNADIKYLLEEVQRSNSHEIKELQEIKSLHRIWKRQFDEGRQTPPVPGGTSQWNNCDSCLYYAS